MNSDHASARISLAKAGAGCRALLAALQAGEALIDAVVLARLLRAAGVAPVAAADDPETAFAAPATNAEEAAADAAVREGPALLLMALLRAHAAEYLGDALRCAAAQRSARATAPEQPDRRGAAVARAAARRGGSAAAAREPAPEARRAQAWRTG
jgi:hypothetical protein